MFIFYPKKKMFFSFKDIFCHVETINNAQNLLILKLLNEYLSCKQFIYLFIL